ncbi:MAG: hypothetical protein J6Y94_05305, partial [Bacteriovoracaceae bacterium]|nr:hypothetical protein [Bacteriovoracaceae bacterium]
MAERKKKDDFTRTMVPEVPAAAKTNVSKVGTVLGKAHFDAKLAQAQAELAAAKAQLAAANKALANLQKPAAASRPSAPARPAAKAPARAAVPPSTDDGGEDLQFKVEVPVGTHGSAVREAVKNSKVQPKVIKIDLDGDHASVPAQPCDAGNRLANPAALACGDYLHGELDPEEEAGDNTAEEVTAITSVHQGVVFNLSSYSSSAVAPAVRRAAG